MKMLHEMTDEEMGEMNSKLDDTFQAILPFGKYPNHNQAQYFLVVLEPTKDLNCATSVVSNSGNIVGLSWMLQKMVDKLNKLEEENDGTICPEEDEPDDAAN